MEDQVIIHQTNKLHDPVSEFELIYIGDGNPDHPHDLLAIRVGNQFISTHVAADYLINEANIKHEKEVL